MLLNLSIGILIPILYFSVVQYTVDSANLSIQYRIIWVCFYWLSIPLGFVLWILCLGMPSNLLLNVGPCLLRKKVRDTRWCLFPSEMVYFFFYQENKSIEMTPCIQPGTKSESSPSCRLGRAQCLVSPVSNPWLSLAFLWELDSYLSQNWETDGISVLLLEVLSLPLLFYFSPLSHEATDIDNYSKGRTAVSLQSLKSPILAL